jgi:hypothetical protein
MSQFVIKGLKVLLQQPATGPYPDVTTPLHTVISKVVVRFEVPTAWLLRIQVFWAE